MVLNLSIIQRVETKKIATVKQGLNTRAQLAYVLTILFFRLLLNFVSIRNISQTREKVFHRLSKHLESRQKYSGARLIFNSLLGV